MLINNNFLNQLLSPFLWKRHFTRTNCIAVCFFNHKMKCMNFIILCWTVDNEFLKSFVWFFFKLFCSIYMNNMYIKNNFLFIIIYCNILQWDEAQDSKNFICFLLTCIKLPGINTLYNITTIIPCIHWSLYLYY